MTDWIGDVRNIWLLAVSIMTALVTAISWGTRRASQHEVHALDKRVTALNSEIKTYRPPLEARIIGIEASVKRIEDHLLKILAFLCSSCSRLRSSCSRTCLISALVAKSPCPARTIAAIASACSRLKPLASSLRAALNVSKAWTIVRFSILCLV